MLNCRFYNDKIPPAGKQDKSFVNDKPNQNTKRYRYQTNNEVFKKQRNRITENLVEILHKRNLLVTKCGVWPFDIFITAIFWDCLSVQTVALKKLFKLAFTAYLKRRNGFF